MIVEVMSWSATLSLGVDWLEVGGNPINSDVQHPWPCTCIITISGSQCEIFYLANKHAGVSLATCCMLLHALANISWVGVHILDAIRIMLHKL